MTATVRRKDPTAIKRVVNAYRGQQVLAVGYPVNTKGTSTQYPDGTPVLLVAAVGTFGSKSRGIPSRNFMSLGGVRALDKTAPLTARLVKQMNAGRINKEQLLNTVGPVAVAEFQQTIIDISEPPNAPATIDAKQSDNPLVDTSLMTQTLTFSVRDSQ